MVNKTRTDIELLGGHPALDFINTVHWRFEQHECDYLHSFQDLVDWHVVSGLLPSTTAKHLLAGTRDSPEKMLPVFKAGIELRELLYRIFVAAAHHKSPLKSDIDDLSGKLTALLPYRHMRTGKHGVKWHWEFDYSCPTSMLGPAADGAVELLTSDKIVRVKECPAPHGCGRLYLDTTRNASRCWCSMKTCGNLAKVRRHRTKIRKRSQLRS
jgi:predicted RNA-binding Zn ribbon-like protein